MTTKTHENPRPRALPPGEAFVLAQLADYAPGSIVSRAIVQTKPGSVTLFVCVER